MKTSFSKYIIVGAGLSGLTTAHMLHTSGETDFKVLESRNRLGGRIQTHNTIDFGATWFHSHHESVVRLLDELQIPKYHQYTKGKSVMVYSSMAPEQYFENDPTVPSAYRISGGSQTLISTLSAPFMDSIVLNCMVGEVREEDNIIVLITEQGTYKAEKVIITIPPRILNKVSFSPKLPKKFRNLTKGTHTWMSNAMKVGIRYRKPFWRKKGLSGTIIGQIGAVTEIYDHTDDKEAHYSLMGFINEGLRDTTAEKRKQRILQYIAKYLGEETMEYQSYEEVDWARDRNTSHKRIKSVYISPEYGNALYDDLYMNGKLLFSGAETSSVHGGYMDGAIARGVLSYKKVIV